ncbi:unnamed protein product [Rotaria sordida]|uniref:Cyclic nucleotide-binding domain-containing protein n=1 Tax=Rotaria sordida TaxID=392033 RepID=A0A813RXI1_9BILA|nr:unnamed protein product [Rotaria sordida]CAF0785910.1 unnamed protein product [Rotaria sordida]CAF0786992.1 unnamed protein product [Rotaria sordida]
MPLAAITPVLNDLLNKDKEGGTSSYPHRSSQPQLPNSNDAQNVGDYLRKPSTISNQFSSTTIDDSSRHHSMTAFRLGKSITREDSFLRRFSNRYGYRGLGKMDLAKRNLRLNIEKEEPIKSHYEFIRRILRTCNYFVISTDEPFLFYWLLLLNIFVLYNLWFSIARQAFDQLQQDYSKIWEIMDYLADAIYFLDIFIQLRTGYLEQGLLVYNHYKLAMNYIRSSRFIFDIISLTPLDILQIKFGSIPILRFPRFLKVYRTFQLYYLQESRTIYPNTYRVLNLFHILLLLGHWLASFYFMVSKAEGFVGYWSYPKPIGNFSQLAKMYLRCLYWSTLTLTTIGDLPPPETNWQWLKNFSNKRYAFLISVHLFAVFVIAIIVGQVGNVITNRNASRLEFERLLDSAKQYMRSHSVPAEMQRRVQRWYDYSWSRGRMSGAGDVHSIKLLPDKLKTELALHVNLGTLKKVTIFQECQPEFLHDLVLKMRAYIFTPGDIICRKGEVAREMFIIADGVLEVVNEKNDVLTRLGAGDFFGEIGILNIDGANRRTADVRSVGYSELFSLSKEDVLEGCRDYPEAERTLYEYAQNRLGFEKAKNEASQKMKGALGTLTSIASCLTHNPMATTPASLNMSPIQENNEKDLSNNSPENEDPTEQTSSVDHTKSISKTSISNLQNFNCDNQDKLLFHQNLSSKNFSLVQSLYTYSNELMNDIESLIRDKMLSIEQSYRQQIAELQEQNERKDIRMRLLEQKLQKLQRALFNRNRLWLEEE